MTNEEIEQERDDTEGVEVQANTLTNAVEGTVQRTEYARSDDAATHKREGASQSPPVPDADQFFEPRYAATLKAIISDIVTREGPIRHDLLVRSVARAHGWQRAGRRIRERVDECLGDNEVRPEGDTVFIWPKGTYAPSIPFRNNLDRSAREVSRSEIRGLIDANPDLGDSVDPALDLARLMGIARLSEDARSYLKYCLAAAGIVSPT